jgi:hypothetical protein
VLAISHPARASIKRSKLQKVAGTAIAGEGGGEKSGDSAGRQGSVRVTEVDVLTGTEVRLQAASQSRDWCPTQGLDSTQQGRTGRATTASRVHCPRPRQTARDGPDAVLETASSRRRTLTVSTSCSWTAWISSILSWEANRVCTHQYSHSGRGYRRASNEVGAGPNWQRDAPPLARASPFAGRHANMLIRPGPGKAAARRHQLHGQPGQPSPAASKVPPLETDLDAPSPRGNQRRTVGPCWARVRCPTRRPRPRPRPRAEAESRRGPRLLRSKEPNPVARTSTEPRLPVRQEHSRQSKGTASLTSKPILVHSAAHTQHDSAQRRPRFACLDWIGCSQSHGSAAACSRLQHAPSAVGSFPGGARLQHSACGCNTLRCADVSHLCCAEVDVPEGSSGGADVGGGWIRLRCRCGLATDSFAVQRWARDQLRPDADVGWGVDLVPVQMWAGMSPVRR